MSDNDIYYIERILDKRKVNGKYEYKIKWEGYPLNQSTWEPLENLQTAMELVNEFDEVYEQQNKNKNESKNNSYLKKKRLLKKEVKKEEKGKEEIEQKEEKNEIIPVEEEKKPDNENNNGSINLEENEYIRKYIINDSLKSVTTVRKKENKLIAEVKKLKPNNEIEDIEIETSRLKTENPWILLDFYESKIKFT